MQRRTLIASLGLAPALVSRRTDAAPLDKGGFARLNLRIAERHLLPRHRRFHEMATALRVAAEALQAEPTEPRLGAARAAYSEAATAHAAIRHLSFGPAELFMRNYRLALWPDPRNAVGRELAETLAAADPQSITPQGFARGRTPVQGLPALERLLWDDDALAALREPAPRGPFRGAMIAAIGRNLEGIAADLETEWTALVLLLGGDVSGPWPEPGMASAALFRALVGGLEFDGDRRLARPLGADRAQARPRLAEAWRSGLSARLLATSQDALAELWRAGFAEALRESGAGDLAALLDRAFAQVRASVQRIGPDLEGAVTEPGRREMVETLLRELVALRQLLASAPCLRSASR